MKNVTRTVIGSNQKIAKIIKHYQKDFKIKLIEELEGRDLKNVEIINCDSDDIEYTIQTSDFSAKDSDKYCDGILNDAINEVYLKFFVRFEDEGE